MVGLLGGAHPETAGEGDRVNGPAHRGKGGVTALGQVFEARYYSRCEACDDWINPGDQCVYEDDEVIHGACAEAGSEDDIQDFTVTVL